MKNGKEKGRSAGSAKGFTLVELLVVISIIALLVAILMPGLAKARDIARCAKCQTNIKAIGNLIQIYTAEWSVYPISYGYPDAGGNVNLTSQDPAHPYGYRHFSYVLLSGGTTSDDVFCCPGMTDNGIPRTNPGTDPTDWEVTPDPSQQDQSGNGCGGGSTIQDRQARRMGYTANAAVIPRNKMTPAVAQADGGNGRRLNIQVRPEAIITPGTVVMAADLLNNWHAITANGNNALVKSHRSVNPFYNVGSGCNEYAADFKSPGFVYPDLSSFLTLKQVMDPSANGFIDGSTNTDLNSIGRHHPGGDQDFGGTANFLYVDGHATNKSVKETVTNREWGTAYYSLTGASQVLN